jgi:hypothetical protein
VRAQAQKAQQNQLQKLSMVGRADSNLQPDRYERFDGDAAQRKSTVCLCFRGFLFHSCSLITVA